MSDELATHISLLAAPIYAVLIAQERTQMAAGGIQAETLALLRNHAIQQAEALWLDVRKVPLS